jgi:hypothetical protein
VRAKAVFWALALTLVPLAGCGKPAAVAQYKEGRQKTALTANTLTANTLTANTLTANTLTANTLTANTLKAKPANAQPSATAPMLAYTYQEDVRAPGDRLFALMDRQKAACASAGWARCQITAAEFSRTNGLVSGSLTLAAEPSWLAAFREALEQEARAAGGRIVRSAVSTEDLTRETTDADAMLKAKLTLRDRLLALIASRPGKLADLLDAERELARVQGEIDAAQSELAVMRGRVQTSTLTINYMSEGSGDGGLDMVGQAIRNSVDISEKALAVLITILAALLPFGLAGGAVWAIWAAVRRRKPRS